MRDNVRKRERDRSVGPCSRTVSTYITRSTLRCPPTIACLRPTWPLIDICKCTLNEHSDDFIHRTDSARLVINKLTWRKLDALSPSRLSLSQSKSANRGMDVLQQCDNDKRIAITTRMPIQRTTTHESLIYSKNLLFNQKYLFFLIFFNLTS